MATGAELTQKQVKDAIAYNRVRIYSFLPAVVEALGRKKGSGIDEAFVRSVADWQEANLGRGAGDGKVGLKTEAHLDLQHPAAAKAARRAEQIVRNGFVLFDSWGNDLRDNNNDGKVDGAGERAEDGAHFTRSYASFGVKAGMYLGQGWNHDKTVKVPRDQVVRGRFLYRVCADIVSQAFHEAGVMPKSRSTAGILDQFSRKGYVWQRSKAYPSEYLPGDFICTLHGGSGHSGVVVRRSSTKSVAIVVELPGPSTQVDLGTYNPASTSDLRLGSWTKEEQAPDRSTHYLGRLLHSRFPGKGR